VSFRHYPHGVEIDHDTFEDVTYDLFLIAEVVIEVSGTYPHGIGDMVGGGTVGTMPVKKFYGCIDYSVFCAHAFLHPGCK